MITKRQVVGQVLFCVGCCCGRTDRGMPAVPVERLKAVWKAERLNRTVQLTISGCLGPCDAANVLAVLTPHGCDWFGRVIGADAFELFIDWGRACDVAGELVPLPAQLEAYRLERFVTPQPLGVTP